MASDTLLGIAGLVGAVILLVLLTVSHFKKG